MRWLYNNLIESSTIEALTEHPDYLFDTAFNDTRLSRVGRTLDVEDQTFLFSFSAAIDADYFVILNHNFTDSATVKIQANTSDSWGSPALDETLTVEDTILINFSTTETYQYWRLYVDDPTNTDGYLEISKCFLGEYIQLPYMAKSQKIPIASNSTRSRSISGQLYGDRQLVYKYGSITFPFITDTEKSDMENAFISIEKVKPFILLIWEDDFTSENPIYAALTKDLEFTRVEDITGRTWSLTFDWEQCF